MATPTEILLQASASRQYISRELVTLNGDRWPYTATGWRRKARSKCPQHSTATLPQICLRRVRNAPRWPYTAREWRSRARSPDWRNFEAGQSWWGRRCRRRWNRVRRPTTATCLPQSNGESAAVSDNNQSPKATDTNESPTATATSRSQTAAVDTGNS